MDIVLLDYLLSELYKAFHLHYKFFAMQVSIVSTTVGNIHCDTLRPQTPIPVLPHSRAIRLTP